jgi:hypothetical protein
VGEFERIFPQVFKGDIDSIPSTGYYCENISKECKVAASQGRKRPSNLHRDQVMAIARTLRKQHGWTAQKISKRDEVRKVVKNNGKPYSDDKYYEWCRLGISGLSPGRPRNKKE